MSATAALARKELRALLPVWLIAAAAVVVGPVSGLGDLRDLSIVAYFAGAAALGAMSIGHEHLHRTLSQLLMQPVPRVRLLAVKTAILAVLLGGLAALALLFPLAQSDAAGVGRATIAVLPILYGLSVAPWIAIETRSPLAGTMLTGSLGALVFIASYFWSGHPNLALDEVDGPRLAFVRAASALICAGGAWGLWAAFTRLEVVDGRGVELPLPSSRPPARRESRAVRHPIALLVGKELRLLPLTLTASILYVVGYLAACAIDPIYVVRHDVLVGISAMHALVVATMAGALSCAEERALGTHEWQLLQPVAAGVQFATKLAVVLIVTFALGVGLPLVLAAIPGLPAGAWPPGRPIAVSAALGAIAAGAMFVSSLAPSGLTALLVCIPAALAVKIFVSFVASPIAGRIFLLLHRGADGRFIMPAAYRVGAGVDVLLVCALTAGLAWLAFDNHRRSGSSLAHGAMQIAVSAAIVLAIYSTFAGFGRLL